MSLLAHPDAQALLADAVVTPEQVRGCQERLTGFLRRYLPRFYRAEQRTHATLVIRGLLSGLQRKTCEPIAIEAGVHRKPIQFFVGAGKWDDEAVMAELRDHVRETLADPEAILVLDPSGFPKSGTESCGSAAVRVGPGAIHPAPGRGGVRRGEGGSRAGAVRGAELGGLAPPHDAVVLGVVVPDPGAVGNGGEKTRP